MPIPEEIGPYRVLRPIARGGMAEVYEVEERRSGEHLALKLLIQEGGALPRFNREYEAMIRLNHPNIVRVYNYGFHHKLPWLSMELVEGTAIQAYAKRCGKPGSEERTGEVLRVAHDLALALDHIHGRGLVHRDLKSANVLVLPDSRVKLIDFGTARVTNPVQAITAKGEFIGTFAYASPEQLVSGIVDPRSDLYSFGVLLFRLATGKRPFDAEAPADLARMHVQEPPPRPRSVAPQIPPALEEIILACLEKQPSDRPSSGQEVAAVLEAIAGQPLLPPGTLDIDVGHERLVGREDQIRQLWDFLDKGDALHDDPDGTSCGEMLLVVGLEGSGRHQMMTALEREVVFRGWKSFNLFFRPGSPDIDQLGATFRSVVRSFDVAPESLAEPAQTLEDAMRSRSQALAERLETIAAAGAVLLKLRTERDREPVVIFVRGLQHAGEAGFEGLVVLRDLLQEVRAPVLLVGDCTENADAPGSVAQTRLPDVMRVHLPPLTEREVALLVGAMLHRRPPPASVARHIYEASGGLPTYVEEVVKGLVNHGLLRVQSRDQNRIEWAKRDVSEIAMPAIARERVMASLAELPADRRRCLEALALCGGEASLGILAGGLQTDGDLLRPALDDLSDRGWITLTEVEGLPYVTWRHILAESVVLDQLHACRRRVLEQLLTDQVEHEPAFAAQIRLLMQDGRLEQALLRARDWAIHHLAKDRPTTALEVLDMVVGEVDELPGQAMLRAELFLVHAACLLSAHPTDPRTVRSLARAEELYAEAVTTESDQRRAQSEILLTRARMQAAIGHFPNFRSQLESAWKRIRKLEPSSLASRIATLLGGAARMAGKMDEAAQWHGRARRLAVEVGDAHVKARADAGVAAWEYAHGYLSQAEKTAAGAMQMCSEADDFEGLAETVSLYTNALRLQGRFSEALDLLHDQLPAMRQSEVPTFYVRLLLANAWCEVDVGRLGRAQECFDELAATVRKGEHLDLRLEADLVYGRIMLASGLHVEAVAKLIEVSGLAIPAGLTVIGEVARSLEAEALWELGDQLNAVRAFQSAIPALKSTGNVPALAEACMAQARAMCHTVDPDKVFDPVADWIDQQAAACARIERQIARGRYLQSMGKPSDDAYDDAESMILGLTERLNSTDAAALRLHPWTRHIRRARRPS